MRSAKLAGAMFALALSLLAALALAAPPRAAPKYVAAQPLAEILTTPVGPVQSGPVQVPIITWGGDIATILGNGNAKATDRSSVFGKLGLNLQLLREDVFAKQLEAYLAGRSPFLRGTLGMVQMAADATARDPRTRPVVIYQLTWSTGGDALVVKGGIKTAKDLRGKTVALQAYGPHVDYLAKILADAGLSMKEVKLKWVADLTGSANSPASALADAGVDAAMVIIPDAMALTSRGTVGTGAEDSVKGARILLTTKTASRIITDVYAVRSDYLQANRPTVENFVRGLLQSQEALKQLVAAKSTRAAEYNKTMQAAAQILLDSAQAQADAEGMVADAEFTGFAANQSFFERRDSPRGFAQLNGEIQTALVAIGLTKGQMPLDHAKWDYARLAGNLQDTRLVETPRFDTAQVATVVTRKQQQGKLAEGELFSFEVFFKPNQDNFPVDQYQEAFKQVVNLASTYGGAIITVEGHSDPMGYLRQKKDGAAQVVLTRTQQSAKNLSLSRASAVREAVVNFAKGRGVNLDPSQFAVVGHGIMQPRTGMCGADPCAPKSEQEWFSNMRVEFRIIQIEAESSVFKPL
ncbi:MAG: ABC transporter substrate-binding protein [Betaproteobacteria bacterium]|nr:ABC transporter substrate-binding protein [Betaproteobacteria bacterium]